MFRPLQSNLHQAVHEKDTEKIILHVGSGLDLGNL